MKWDAIDVAKKAKALGFDGVDFHARLLADPQSAPARVKEAIDATGLVLSGFSLSTDFNKDDSEAFKKEIENANTWIRVAAKTGAPCSRIFGGHLSKEQRADPEIRKQKLQRILDALGQVVKVAEREGVILALENHGGLPCTGEEQVMVIDAIGSRNLRATVDVGNYLQGGQESEDGTKAAAGHCAYVHFKDFRKIPSTTNPTGFDLQGCIVGTGDVHHKQCLEQLHRAGYSGFVALEYEGVEGEDRGVPESAAFLQKVIAKYR
jgi:sugar phosphate isomerase/epimerase